jgi:plasmid stabilization system protein ParE
MARRIRLRPRARADMLDIWKYIAAENERAAEKNYRSDKRYLSVAGI